MALRIQGLQLGNMSGGPVSISLDNLDDVSINAPVTSNYLRYNGVLGEWQNTSLDADVFNYLSTNLLSSGNITITPIVGPNTITLGLVLDSADIVTSLGYTPVDRAGDTMTGSLILNADPTVAFGAATKHYVDNVAAGLTIHPSCVTGTTAPLTAIYNNGAAGLGATLTGSGSLPSIGGYTAVDNDRVLIKNQVSAIENGIYVVTVSSPNWVLTRSSDFDGSPTSDITAGDLVFVQSGTLGGTQWVQVTTGVVDVGIDPIVFQQFSGPGTYSGGPGISVSGTTISNTGVLSVTGTAGQITASASTGAITLSLPSNISGLNSITAASFVGNSSSSTVLQTGRTFSLTGDATGTSATFNGSSNASIPLTLATVNGSPQTDSFRKVTVNGKGLVTATSAVTASDITSLVDGTYVNVTGDTMTGALLLSLAADSAQGVSITNSSTGTSAQARLVVNNDQADSLNIGVNSSGFTGSGSGSARESFIRSGLTSTGLYLNAQAGNIRIATNSVERLRFDTTGAWGLAGANYGTSGQVLTSNGSGTAPTWTSLSSVPTSTTAVNLAGGTTGQVPYQSSSSTTAFVTNAAGVLQAATSGAVPAWTTAPTLTGTNFTGIPNSATTATSANTASTIVSRDVSGNFSAGTITATLSGNASTATSLVTARNISATGDATWSVSFNGSSDVSGALTLSTVNSSPQTDALRKVTVNAKGLVTATSAVTAGDITPLVDGTYVNVTGDTMTGNLIGTAFRAAQGVPNSADLSTNGFAFGTDGDTGLFAPGAGSAAGIVSLYSNNTEVLQASATNGIIGRTFAQFEGGYLRVTQASTAQRLLIGNQDSGGVNNPGMIVGANGTVQLGYGNTWAGNGGTFTSTFQSASSGNTSFVTLTTSGLTVTGQSYFRNALPYAGFSSAATFDYTGSGTEFGITLRPASSSANTNAISFLSSSSTPASPVQLGAIQHLTSNSGLDLSGNWTVNGSSFITGANIASQSVSSANVLTTTRSISATGDANWSVNFNGSSNVSSGLTLATVNSSPQTDAFVKTTVNSKGLVTATSPVTSSDITGLLGSVYVLKTGDTMTGSLTISQGSASISINAVNASSRASTIFRSNGSNRWVVGKLNNAESGSNTGSDFNITRYDDSGNFIDAPVLISRSTGVVTMTSVTASSFNATSTVSVKEHVKDLSDNYLKRFDQLRPREYDRKDYAAHEFGFIAEEMEEIYPEIVSKDQVGKPTGIDYGKLSTILTAKVLEQQSEIDMLKEQVRRILGELSAR